MKSNIRTIGPVSFPEHTNERVYMVPFFQRTGLPTYLSRWQRTVDAMLEDIKTDGPIFLMIDQGIIQPGRSHRRGGPHIDGNWLPATNSHGGSTGGSHTQIRSPDPEPDKHVGRPPAHNGLLNGDYWSGNGFEPEALILASNVNHSCCAYVGQVEGDPKKGGDCSHLDLSNTERVLLNSNTAYSGNVTMIHESMPLSYLACRTLVRLNVPGVEI
jgi:hypothetical protein